jgi:hypothetical protein
MRETWGKRFVQVARWSWGWYVSRVSLEREEDVQIGRCVNIGLLRLGVCC